MMRASPPPRSRVANVAGRVFRAMRERLSRLAPEEIGGGVLLVALLVAVALHPSAIGRVFESPYATPAPENIARTMVARSATPTVAPRIDAGRRQPVGTAPVFPGAPTITVGPDGGRIVVVPNVRPFTGDGLTAELCWKSPVTGASVCVPVVPPRFVTPTPSPSR